MRPFGAAVMYLASANAIDVDLDVGATAVNITSMADVRTVIPVVEGGSIPQLSVSWLSEIIQTANESYDMLMVGFSVSTQGTSVIVAGDYVMSYLSLPDPDNAGKLSTLTCTVAYTASDLYQSADNIWIQNYYGTNSFKKGKAIAGGFKPGST